MRLLIATLLCLAGVSGGCAGPKAQTDAASTTPDSTAGTFQPEHGMDAGNWIRVDPMIESASSLSLRARRAGLPVEQLVPQAYGLIITTLYPDVEIGVAFLRQRQIYHLDGFDRRIFVDEKYLYGKGFLSPEVIQVSERGWSREHAVSDSEITLLKELSSAVQRGTGRAAAFDAVSTFGPLALGRAPETRQYEREASWLVGTQRVDSAYFSIGAVAGLGNRLATRFVNPP